jgi:hypothetical protein
MSSEDSKKLFENKQVLNGEAVNVFDFLILRHDKVPNIGIDDSKIREEFLEPIVTLRPDSWVSFNININNEHTITFEGTDVECVALTACKTLEELANMANSLGEARLQ